MTFTNTDCVGKDWTWYKVRGKATWQVNGQVNYQVNGQVYKQINPIRNKITQEINK